MTDETREAARYSAATIKRQLGVFGLGVVGASALGFTGDGGLTFKARLHFAGQSKVRICRITITPNALDLYDVDVYHSQRQARFESLYADDLTTTMYRIDAEGF